MSTQELRALTAPGSAGCQPPLPRCSHRGLPGLSPLAPPVFSSRTPRPQPVGCVLRVI